MSRLMAIDIGNSRAKWGLHDGRAWIDQNVIDTSQLNELAKQLKTNKNFNIINKLYISSVADKQATIAFANQMQFTGAEIKIVQSCKQQRGVINHYQIPEQLGTDRWCALITARHLYDGPAVVVMAGTAMTVDALTADGHFHGGMIVPGISLMQESLRSRTANLRPQTAEYQSFPVNTQDAIYSGIISASIGAIEQMRHALKAAGHAKVTCIIGGGAATLLLPHISEPKIHAENLVLEGLLQIAKSESTERT